METKTETRKVRPAGAPELSLRVMPSERESGHRRAAAEHDVPVPSAFA